MILGFMYEKLNEYKELGPPSDDFYYDTGLHPYC